MLKQKALKYLAPSFYPQNIFAASILKHIHPTGKKETLIDAPCGNGETSYHFSSRRNLEVFAYDLDARSIESAKRNFKRSNLHFDTHNIFDVFPKHQNTEYFCIINSLFLLPGPEKILQNASQTLATNGTLFVIVPNIHGKNYTWFRQRNPAVNKLELDRSSFASYFAENGLTVKHIIPLAFTHNFGRRDVKLFSVFSHFYLRFLNSMQTLFNIGKPNYYLIVSIKKQ